MMDTLTHRSFAERIVTDKFRPNDGRPVKLAACEILRVFADSARKTGHGWSWFIVCTLVTYLSGHPGDVRWPVQSTVVGSLRIDHQPRRYYQRGCRQKAFRDLRYNPDHEQELRYACDASYVTGSVSRDEAPSEVTRLE